MVYRLAAEMVVRWAALWVETTAASWAADWVVESVVSLAAEKAA